MQGKQKYSNIDNLDKDLWVCPTVKVKEMYDLYLETVRQYNHATLASKYNNCGVHCGTNSDLATCHLTLDT